MIMRLGDYIGNNLIIEKAEQERLKILVEEWKQDKKEHEKRKKKQKPII